MDGNTPEDIALSAEALIKAANEAQFLSLADLREFIRKHLAIWHALEVAPIGELPKRRYRRGSRERPQGVLALIFEEEPITKRFCSTDFLGVTTWLPDADNNWLDTIWARLKELPGAETTKVAVITNEGEAVIRTLVRHSIEAASFTPTTVKYAVSKAVLDHYKTQADQFRGYKTFREFANFNELEEFLRIHCPYIYSLGRVFTHKHTVLTSIESFTCICSPLSPDRGLVIARRNRETGKVEITAQGAALIGHPHTSRIKSNSTDNVSLGSALIYQIHRQHIRPHAGDEKHRGEFSTLAEATEYLARIPALKHIPFEVDHGCIVIKRKKKTPFKLIQPFKNKFAETSELNALLENFFTITICLDELQALYQLELASTRETGKKKTSSKRKIQRQRENVVEHLINLITGDPINLNLPVQQALPF